MTSRELLERSGDWARRYKKIGQGGHVRVELNGGVSHVPTGSGELTTGLVHGVLKQLGLTMRDLR